MNSLSPEYTLLFNTLTDAIEELTKLRTKLVEAQKQAEERYIGEDI